MEVSRLNPDYGTFTVIEDFFNTASLNRLFSDLTKPLFPSKLCNFLTNGPTFVGPGGFVGVTVGLVAGFVAVVLAEVGPDGFVGVTEGLVAGFVAVVLAEVGPDGFVGVTEGSVAGVVEDGLADVEPGGLVVGVVGCTAPPMNE